ncbi:hypothetical protein SH580_08790 [Coraliomargarita algicola]|uniref:Uncharacterized protein n=1 Tax=Coraliomargarita algicola TaxID=3092156 RepID=A0ABZ0RSD0_9BACT|nr:hypothetical protein [Coraliomargarita sp. J2-16]WPJ97807.1 hypothetical protein SH580_08790 [Coraliomargarita sp. J2-16]
MHPFHIPKQTDVDIVNALGRIRDELNDVWKLTIHVNLPPTGNLVQLNGEIPAEEKSLQFVFNNHSEVIPEFRLQEGNVVVFQIQRKSEVTDNAEIHNNAFNQSKDENQKAQRFVALMSSARKALRALDIEAAFEGEKDTTWNRYRKAQSATLNSLQKATADLILKASEQNARLDEARSKKFSQLEEKLRGEIAEERKTLEEAHQSRLDKLEIKEKAQEKREAEFETKESHYVARQKQAEQIKQVQDWLEEWKLTPGTTKKRRPIAFAYCAALIFTGLLSLYATWHSYNLLQDVDKIASLEWWQWLGIWAKSIFPLAGFITFMIYFIRWSGDWARQHSDEEFRNRTRLVDIGRSSWILEAVRDAQERKSELPPQLLEELSRNLFSHTSRPEGDIHPQAISDLLSNGLTGLRVKTSDGSEVEATRGKLR